MYTIGTHTDILDTHAVAMQLWLVRHAQPQVAPGVCYGALDVSADPFATQQAAQNLGDALPRSLQVISSPLQRCERLTHVLQGLRPDLTYKTDARLAEMNFGAWEGQPWDAIVRSELDAWTDDFAHWRCGGGENLQRCGTPVVRTSSPRYGLPTPESSGRPRCWRKGNERCSMPPNGRGMPAGLVNGA